MGATKRRWASLAELLEDWPGGWRRIGSIPDEWMDDLDVAVMAGRVETSHFGAAGVMFRPRGWSEADASREAASTFRRETGL